MRLRSTLPHPSIYESYTFNTVPSETSPATEEEDLISLYKRSNSARKEDLLYIMSETQLTQLQNELLAELDAAIEHLKDQQHPAAAPARDMADAIRAQKLPAYRTFAILQKTVDLAVTPATSPEFAQKTDEFRKTMGIIKHDAKTHLFYGAAIAFGCAMALAGIIVMSVLVSPAVAILSWKDIIGPAIGTGILSLFTGAVSGSFFTQYSREMKMLNKMGAFEKAMHEAPAPKL